MDRNELLERLLIISEQLTDIAKDHHTHLLRIDTAIEGINTTLARVETLIARMIPSSEDGKDA